EDADLKHLRFTLESGGLLLADACCGADEFDASFHRLVEALLWKDHKLEPIPPHDELFSKELNGEAITTVLCRRRGADGKVSAEFKEVKPELQGIKIDGRWAVVYSRYDLGCALERRPAPNCLGHDYDSALKLARAAVLYALNR